MCERLAAKRVHTCRRGGGHAGHPGIRLLPIVQPGNRKASRRFITAKTSADQQALATIFQKEAQVAQRGYQASADEGGLCGGAEHADDGRHCDAIAKQYQEIAKELTSMAEMHKEMAAMAR
jgi:hypothetical protein